MGFFLLIAFVLVGLLWIRTNRLKERVRHLSERLDAVAGKRSAGLEMPPTPERGLQQPDYGEKPWPVAQKPPSTMKVTPKSVEPPPIPVEAARAEPEFVHAATSIAQSRAATAVRPAERKPEPPLKSLDEIIREKLRSLGPKDPSMGWEMALGTYWLPRIGMAALSVAVVFLLTLALQKWGPPVRVAIGYGVCAGLLALAWRLERKTPGFARVLFGGGFALLYFVSFSTHFVPFARVFETPYITLALLAAIVAGWAAVAQRRRSPTIAMLVTALGHFTIGLATYAIDEPGRVSVVGILALSAGSAFFLLRNRWYYVAAVGLVASYVNHAYVLTRSDAPDEVGPFALGMGALAALFLIYALAELFAPERLRRKSVPVWFRSSFVTVNTLGLFALGSLLMDGFTFTEHYQYIFRYVVALVLVAVALAYLRRRRLDPIYNVYFTKAVAATTLGLADQFSAESLTAWLAVEMVALLYSARRSGLLVTRLLAFAVSVIALGHGLYTAVEMTSLAYAEATYAATVATASITCFGFFAAALLYQWTDWTARSPRVLRFADSTRMILWELDLSSEPPESARDLKKPLDGLLFSHVYALAGAALFLAFLPRLAEESHRLLPLGAFALGLTVAAWALRAAPLGAAASVGLAGALVMGTTAIMDGVTLAVAATSLGCLGLAALGTERRYFPAAPGLALHQTEAGLYVWYGAVVWFAGLFVSLEYAAGSAVATLTGGAVIAAALTNVLHLRALAYSALALFVWANVIWHAHAIEESAVLSAWLTTAVAAVGILGDRYFTLKKLRELPPVFLTLTWALLMQRSYLTVEDRWFAAIAAAIGAAALVYGLSLRSVTACALALLGASVASLVQITLTQQESVESLPLFAGYLAPVVLWIAFERLFSFAETRFGYTLGFSPSGIFVGIATGLLVMMLYHAPRLQEFYLTIAWTVLAVALFGLSLVFAEKVYRFAGLAVLLLASLRVVFVDTRGLETLPKVASWAVLGFVLIALGYGYVKAFARTGPTSPPPQEEVGPDDPA